MPRGAEGLLYRPFASASGAPRVDRHGDPLDDSGAVIRPTSPENYLGKLYGILPGGPAATENAKRRGEAADTKGMFGIPLENELKVQQDDRIVLGPVTYKVVSRPDWGYPNTLTTTRPTYVWIQVSATTDD